VDSDKKDGDLRLHGDNSSSSDRRKPKKNVNDRVGGTSSSGIAKGKSSQTLKTSRDRISNEVLPAMTPEKRRRFNEYLDGPAGDLRRTRLSRLREDDKDRDVSNLSEIQRLALQKRGERGNRGLRTKMERTNVKRLENALAAKDAEEVLHTQSAGMVEAEGDMEHTSRLSQVTLRRDHLDEQTARQVYDLKLPDNAPYSLRYDRSGRFAIMAGKRGGHLSVIDQHTMALRTEIHVRETVRDAVFLHDGTMTAVAQQKNVFVYDDKGAEVHRMAQHDGVHALDFLPHHWLLATVGHTGYLKYQDTSTGNLVSQHRTKLGPCRVMRQNPSNAVIHLGHTNGSVTLWSPTSNQYLAKMLCHRGAPVLSLAVDQSGRHMVTGGADGQVRVWDLRTYKELHSYYTQGGPPTALDVSQTGILGIGHGCNATFWGPDALNIKAKVPYMRHQMPGCNPIETVRFRPFEDVVGIGHTRGVSSIVIPGCGEPNLDSAEYGTNPYQDNKQRREAEVRSLLDKLSPDMIVLDPDAIASVEESRDINRVQRARDMAEEANARKRADDEERKNKKEVNRMRGKNKIKKKLRRKNKNVWDENSVKLKEATEKDKKEREQLKLPNNDGGDGGGEEEAPAALSRFF